VLLAISVNNLINIDYKTFIIESKNERIINSTYFYVIKVTFSNQCNLGQYYDTIMYFFFNDSFHILISKTSLYFMPSESIHIKSKYDM